MKIFLFWLKSLLQNYVVHLSGFLTQRSELYLLNHQWQLKCQRIPRWEWSCCPPLCRTRSPLCQEWNRCWSSPEDEERTVTMFTWTNILVLALILAQLFTYVWWKGMSHSLCNFINSLEKCSQCWTVGLFDVLIRNMGFYFLWLFLQTAGLLVCVQHNQHNARSRTKQTRGPGWDA